MNTKEFWDLITEMNSISGRGSGNKKEQKIKDILVGNGKKQPYWALRFIIGSPMESWEGDIGAKKKTVRKAITDSFETSYDNLREIEKDKGNLSQAITELDRPDSLTGRGVHSLSEVGVMIKNISRTSGTHKITTISSEMGEMENPQVLSYAILNDISFGVGVATIKNALESEFNTTRAELDIAHGINPDISDLYMQLRENGEVRTTLKVGDRISPQKARKGSLDDANDSTFADTKYDGGRVLIHNNGAETRAFSRKQNEVTENLPELQDIQWPSVSFILDAEAVGYDPETGEPVPFQRFMTRFQRENNIEEKMEDVEIKFKVFDALYWKGDDLRKVDFIDRRKLIEASLPSEVVADGGLDAGDQFEKALDEGHEGIIIKNKDANYKFKRSSTWKKVKPIKEPIEVRVVSAIIGTGKYSDTLGALKVETKEGIHLGRVGTGFKDSDRDELWEMFQNRELADKVIEVEFEELQENNGSYGLRFPRYVRLRPDGEADTLDRIKQL